MEEKITTTENLATELLGCMGSAIVDYGNYTVAVWEHCHKGSIAEIYKLIEMPKEYELGRCECKISRIERKESFEDPGHAMKWALDKVVNGNKIVSWYNTIISKSFVSSFSISCR